MAQAKRGAASDLRPEDILADHPPAVRELAERLRNLVRQAVPEASEVAYPVWHGIGYRHPEAGYLCAIFPHDTGVKLGFEFGALLPDPQGLLTGSGKQVRYLLMDGEADIPVQAIKKLLQAAIRLPARRAFKQGLVEARARPLTLGRRAAKRTPSAKKRSRAAPRKAALPRDFRQALAQSRQANAAFERLPPSHQREHLGYIEEAKRPETRARRIQKTIAQLSAEGGQRR